MEREIKFRAYGEDSKKMYYSDSQEDAKFLGAKLGSSLISTFFNTFFGNKTLGQFTGLKDKKGFEVYEGDINHKGYVIKWNQLHNCFGWFNKNGFVSEIISNPYDNEGNISFYKIDCEIIGNIHENPELLC